MQSKIVKENQTLKIGMLTAMIEEAVEVVSWLGKPVKTEQFGQFTVLQFQKGNCQIYMLNAGVGEILASAGATFLITKYNVDCVINFGLCGALGGQNLSQMCVVSGIVHYDFDLSALEGTEVGRYSRFESAVVNCQNDLTDLVLADNPNIQKVVCASADKFVSDENVKLHLAKTFGAQICEMESAGILFATKTFGVPSLFIKVVSDTKDHKEEFNEFVARNNFNFVSVLEKLIKKLGN